MTDVPKQPDRRWRRLVVTFAILALLFGWWFWPRADERFLGKWTLRSPPGDMPEPETVVLLEFTRGGHASRTWYRTGQKPFVLPGMRWWIEGDEFVFYQYPMAYWARAKDYATKWWRRLTTGTTWKTHRSAIREITPNRIVMVSDPGTDNELVYIYVRLSDGEALP